MLSFVWTLSFDWEQVCSRKLFISDVANDIVFISLRFGADEPTTFIADALLVLVQIAD